MSTIIFDFDGTICDSLDTYLKLYNKFLEQQKRKAISRHEFRSLGVLKIAQREKISKIRLFWYVFFARRYIARHIDDLHPFPRVAQEIRKLSKKYKLGIITSNSKKNVLRFLKNNNLEKEFAFVESQISYFGKASKLTSTTKKYNLEKSKCFYVGDETRDIQASKKAEIKAIAVTWGFEFEDLLKKEKPDLTISKYSSLCKKISEKAGGKQ